VRLARWIDHLPPWVSFGSLASSGSFSGPELALMAAPLAAAALVEARRWDVSRYRRFLEIAALGAVLLQVFLKTGLVLATVNTLFLLIGIRLALPREAPQHRQLLLMGFLLFLVTAIASFEVDFLLWALAWLVVGSLALLHHAWESSASLRGSIPRPPPYTQTLRWAGACILLAAVCFAVLPRQTLGLRFFPWGAGGLSGSTAGLSNTVDLLDRGPIQGNHEVVLRIVPFPEAGPERRALYEDAFALLRGLTLEGLDGQRWEALPDTPAPFQHIAMEYQWTRIHENHWLGAELYVAPNPFGIIPLPVGSVGPLPPPGMPIHSGPGGSTRWAMPSRRPVPLRILMAPGPIQEPLPKGARLKRLTDVGEGTEATLAWSRRIVPEDVPPEVLVRRLSTNLRTFAYTLDNPSGGAPNPLQDFLERTRAGHCEYFASALALALRHRGVPSRVVNGYRLGPWIQEGGYWLVTQDLAHSWVEYYDPDRHRWNVADPTPSGASGSMAGETLWAAVQHWTDTLRFRWDRNIVRFSDEDQVSALTWVQERASELPSWRPSQRSGIMAGALLAGFLGLRLLQRWRKTKRPAIRSGPRGILALKPLLRRAGAELPPGSGETARAWLQRLASIRPDMESEFSAMADEVDAVAYGGRGDERLRHLARRLARALGSKRT
jgi:transglutaminase-like putative cysteine protease